MRKKPELLSPAGDMERLRMAVAYGADAVYLAGTSFGMRSFAGNFTPEELPEAVAYAHAHGVRTHVTVNTLARNDEIARLPAHLELLNEIGVDALIIADLGAWRLAERYAPRCERHVSTQVSVTNHETAKAWYELGAKRVVLARELSLPEIRGIREKAPAKLELEVFCHGAMCVSWSGRCLLSNYMTGRDPQRGACAQPCRYKYALMEEKRPGEYFPVFEDEKGTFIMNSRDMCMIDHLDDLMDLDCLKIEGRAKSAYYAACVTNAYRHGIDAALSGEPLDPVWRAEVDKISHRYYYTGFYFGQPQAGQFYDDARYIRDWDVAAYVVSCDEAGNAVLTQRGRFWKGDTLELLIPGRKPVAFTVMEMQNAEGESIDYCPHPEMEIRMTLPVPAPEYSILRRQADEKTRK